MASGPLVGGGGGDGSREKQKWGESKVYTRKAHNKGSKKTIPSQIPSQTLASEDGNSSQQQQISTRFDAASDDSSSLNRRQVGVQQNCEMVSGYGSLRSMRLENRITINFASKPKHEKRELRRKLVNELELVRSMVKKLEAKELQLGGGGGGGGYSQSQYSASEPFDNGGGKRANLEGGSVGPHTLRPVHQLSVSLAENSQGGAGDMFEKEKRTPKVNKYYRNSDFISGKDKFPPPESNKKSKSSNSKKHGGGGGSYGFGMERYPSPAFIECGNLLDKLMKHKHGWVFNKPVDVKLLGLHDYYTIIKHPMDLGTVKTKLNKNWYKSPREFAEDVRLTFRNAMTYNPIGQDVHVMAELLLKMFEDGWGSIEVAYNTTGSRLEPDYEVGAPTPTSKKTPAPPPFHEMRRTLDRSESMTLPTNSKPKSASVAPSGRTPAPKKPKAKEPNKRDMTYEEKQKLSMNLQSLPPEKLDNIVQIIKRRNSSLCQRDDEIEVDIDVVDPETLWELDRFVTNYKKSLSKNKRKAELAMQPSGAEHEHSVPEMNLAPAVAEAPKETKLDAESVPSSSPVQGEKQGDNASRSSSSSSSSSDSGSSSSDSDSDSSSGSEAGQG